MGEKRTGGMGKTSLKSYCIRRKGRARKNAGKDGTGHAEPPNKKRGRGFKKKIKSGNTVRPKEKGPGEKRAKPTGWKSFERKGSKTGKRRTAERGQQRGGGGRGKME